MSNELHSNKEQHPLCAFMVFIFIELKTPELRQSASSGLCLCGLISFDWECRQHEQTTHRCTVI